MDGQRPIVALARKVFSLRGDTDYDSTTRQISADAELRSAGVWSLAFAILIASVGLNVNSTAVIIGAMLISPLMGPIVGMGLALGTDNLALLRTSVRTLLVSTAVALAASTAYFAISPLSDAQSELLARTTPTLYDVLIALFGGGAGIVAVSRKSNTSTVVPGVAIATALMPPLCTAGYGLSQGDFWFFVGAMDLFLINALFICLASLVFVRLMRFERVADMNTAAKSRVHLFVGLLTMALVLPSIYTGWVLVQETRFRRSARRFLADNLGPPDRSLINVSLRYARDTSSIDATVVGQPLDPRDIDSLERRLPGYGLANVRLLLRQPFGKQLSPAEVSELIRDGIRRNGATDVNRDASAAAVATESRIRRLQDSITRIEVLPARALATELAALYPALSSMSLGRRETVDDTATVGRGTINAVARWKRMPSAAEHARIRTWLALRLQTDSLDLFDVLAR